MNKTEFLVIVCTFILTGLLLKGNLSAEMAPYEILRQADEARGNLAGIKWTVHIVSTKGKKDRDRKLVVESKGYDFLATFIAPSRVKRQRLLTVQRNMWFMKPGLRKPVPISPRQRLIGAASYGDIAATNYSDDYKAVLVAEENLDDESCYVFDLKAINKKATYDRIKYWISKTRHVGLKADFYTISGKLLKSANFEYENQIRKGDKLYPFISTMLIKDTFLKDDITTMEYSDYKLVDIPPATFDLNFLMMR